MTLPAFKKSPTCPKCGSDHIEFSYQSETKFDEDTGRYPTACGNSNDDHLGEHIHLFCNRCSYGKAKPWLMGVAESPRTVGFIFRSVVPSDSTGVVTE